MAAGGAEMPGLNTEKGLERELVTRALAAARCLGNMSKEALFEQQALDEILAPQRAGAFEGEGAALGRKFVEDCTALYAGIVDQKQDAAEGAAKASEAEEQAPRPKRVR
jgi:hypothetical protein